MEKINKPQVYTHQVWPADFILCNKSRSEEEVLSFQQMMLKQKDTQFQKGGKKKNTKKEWEHREERIEKTKKNFNLTLTHLQK